VTGQLIRDFSEGLLSPHVLFAPCRRETSSLAAIASIRGGRGQTRPHAEQDHWSFFDLAEQSWLHRHGVGGGRDLAQSGAVQLKEVANEGERAVF
jgi:hypothetical protein